MIKYDLTPGSVVRTQKCPHNIEIPLPHYTMETAVCINTSPHARVSKLVLTGMPVIVKSYTWPLGIEVETELMCLACLQSCPYVVDLYGYWVDEHPLVAHLVLECAPCDMFDVIHNPIQQQWISFKSDKHTIMQQLVAPVCSALQVMHNKHIIYRDLKPENILLSDAGHAKLCDFGQCVFVQHNQPIPHITHATIEYMSPEMIFNNRDPDVKYSYKSDVFSFGIFLYEFFMHRTPFKNREEILKHDVALDAMATPVIPLMFREIISRCLEKDPIHRPSFQDILDWLQSFTEKLE
jgi:serine/threonine protein kinase